MDVAASRGCLEPHELELVAHSEVGRLRPDLAGHLAACAVCQRRLLALDLPDRGRRSRPQDVPLSQRVLRVLLVIAAILAALLTLTRFAG